jgi:hypothetical protein
MLRKSYPSVGHRSRSGQRGPRRNCDRTLFLICTQYSSRFRVDPVQAGARCTDHSFKVVVAAISRIISDPTLYRLPGVRAAIEERGHLDHIVSRG